MPRVVIEEFVESTSDNEEDCPCEGEDANGKKERPHKLKTHYEIDDVSTHFTFYPNSSETLTKPRSSNMGFTKFRHLRESGMFLHLLMKALSESDS